MIAAGTPQLTVHSLLNDHPMSIVGDDKAVQVELKPILHRRTVDLGNQTAGPGECWAIEAHPISDRDELLWRLPRILSAPAANMDAELVLQRRQSALQCADDTRGDP